MTMRNRLLLKPGRRFLVLRHETVEPHDATFARGLCDVHPHSHPTCSMRTRTGRALRVKVQSRSARTAVSAPPRRARLLARICGSTAWDGGKEKDRCGLHHTNRRRPKRWGPDMHVAAVNKAGGEFCGLQNVFDGLVGAACGAFGTTAGERVRCVVRPGGNMRRPCGGADQSISLPADSPRGCRAGGRHSLWVARRRRGKGTPKAVAVKGSLGNRRGCARAARLRSAPLRLEASRRLGGRVEAAADGDDDTGSRNGLAGRSASADMPASHPRRRPGCASPPHFPRRAACTEDGGRCWPVISCALRRSRA